MTILDPGASSAGQATAKYAAGKAKTASAKTTLVCRDCGAHHAKWTGQCSVCGEWNTLDEEVVERAVATARVAPALGPLSKLDDVDSSDATARSTDIGELDRVLGGGLVAGSVTLLGGEPGIGKSTLMLQMVARWPGTTLYLSGEESPQQVKNRALRVGGDLADVWIGAETSLRGVIDAIEQVKPELVIIDSIQTIADERIASSPGSTTQVRECAQQLVFEAKRRGTAIVLVGHVTKEGSIAGPRALEHVVDTVLSFEGERHHALRMLRAVKHRFGATNELGLFEMVDDGLHGVPDPAHLFLSDRRPGVPGSMVVAAMEGHRPLLVEVQALTIPVPNGASTRRTVQGLDSNRLAMLLAVLDRRIGVRVADSDVYASTVGGARLVEPGIDLGIALAVASAVTNRPLPRDLVAVGEVGLGGELRQVSQTSRRLSEAARLGYRRAIVPRGGPEIADLRVHSAESLVDAIARFLPPD